jgi:RND family efflux transporter MFP subunit
MRLPFLPQALRANRIQGAHLLIALCAGLALTAPTMVLAAETANAAKPVLTVTTTRVQKSTLPLNLQANGNVAAWQEASVAAEVGGLRITDILVNVGDVVQAGQVLAQLSVESVQADVAIARAQLAEAQAGSLDAGMNADRARALQNDTALSAQQISQMLNAEQMAKARLEAAKAGLDSQLLRLKHSQILAPDSGTIIARNAALGAVVAPGGELFRLVRKSRLEWRAEVTAAEFSRIAPGAGVRVTAPGGGQWQGRVRMLAPTVDPQSRVGLVYVDLLGPLEKNATLLKPGMYAPGEFVLGQTAALTVAQQAVVVRDGFSYCFRVQADGRVTQTRVNTGRRANSAAGPVIEVLDGLEFDALVVASGAGFLRDGDTVKVAAAAANAPTAPAKPSASAAQ